MILITISTTELAGLPERSNYRRKWSCNVGCFCHWAWGIII